MTEALLWGCLAAVAWAAASLATIPALKEGKRFWPILFWFFLCSAMAIALAALVVEGPPDATRAGVQMSVLAGLTFAAANAIFFVAMRAGNVSTVIPIVACDGAVAAVIAALTGATIAFGIAIGLAAMVIGTLILATREQNADEAGAANPVTLVAAVGSALGFGAAFYVSGEVDGVSPMWLVAFARAAAVVAAGAICLASGGLRVPARTTRWILAIGLTDAVGYVAFVKGAVVNLPVAAVATSQYAGIAVIGGILVFRERLGRRDLIGIVVLALAAAVVAAQS